MEVKRLRVEVGLLFLAMILCFVLVPIISYFVGGWYAYWGHAVLAILFAVIITLIRTVYYWEEQ